MAELQRFEEMITGLVKKADELAKKREAQREKMEEAFHEMLVEFDKHADRLQEEVIAPRIAYLGGMFKNAVKPEIEEDSEYRHRIHLHFAHTEEFPCIADVTFVIVHDAEPGFYNVKFEYIILPAYVTDKYKASELRRVAMGDDSHPELVSFVESRIAEFLEHYLKARKA